MAPRHEKAHLVVPSSKAQGEVTFPFVLGIIGTGNQCKCGGWELKATDGVNGDIGDAWSSDDRWIDDTQLWSSFEASCTHPVERYKILGGQKSRDVL